MAERSNVTREIFEQEIVPAQRPVVLRSLVADWPMIATSAGDAAAVYRQLAGLAADQTVRVMVAPAAAGGRFHYNHDLSGFNFETRDVDFRQLLSYLVACSDQPTGLSIAMQSAPAARVAPEFEAGHRLDLLAPGIAPRLWLGNAATVAAHYDPSENIACVVAGRRRFTLFPPDQVANLYIGPLEHTPAGASVSLAPSDALDLEAYPRMAAALAASQTADLGPGDAIYIPYLWWHQVQALNPLNLLVNYWWDPAPADRGEPHQAFIHAMIAISTLSSPHRQAWKTLFDHYVFKTGDDPADHIPVSRRGVLGVLDGQALRAMRRELARKMSPESDD